MVRFQISTRHTGHRRVVKVFVYDTKAEMREAVKHYDWWAHRKTESDAYYRAAGAFTHMYWLVAKDKLGRRRKGAAESIIRFTKQQLNTEVVVHEATHAALHFFQSDTRRKLGRVEDEEGICYLAGDLSRKIVNKLYDKGVWTT